jgi:beta-lactamase regulating signal transducer with metallopeptidase domain
MFNIETLSVWSEQWIAALLDAAVKGTALLGFAALAASVLRKRSAAIRQLVWVLALGVLLVLPLVSQALPAWQVLPSWVRWQAPRPPVNQTIEEPPKGASQGMERPKLPLEFTPTTETNTLESPTIAKTPINVKPVESAEPKVATISEISRAEPSSRATAPPAAGILFWLTLVWAVGLIVCLTPLVLGRISLWRLARGARRFDGSWDQLVRKASRALGMHSQPVLLMSRREPMPMVWGVFRPKLLLPAEARNWSDDRRWVVLLHELSHAKRHDCLAKLIAHVTCAVYWFNPLCWMAFKQMQREAEVACDDLVVTAGHRPSDYAQHLLEIASGLNSGVLAAYSSIALARPSEIESRLLSILDPKRCRRRMTAGGLLIAALLMTAIALPLSIMQAAANDNKPTTESVVDKEADTQPSKTGSEPPEQSAEQFPAMVKAKDKRSPERSAAEKPKAKPLNAEQARAALKTILALPSKPRKNTARTIRMNPGTIFTTSEDLLGTLVTNLTEEIDQAVCEAFGVFMIDSRHNPDPEFRRGLVSLQVWRESLVKAANQQKEIKAFLTGGPAVADACQRALVGLKADDLAAGRLAYLLGEIGRTESMPILIDLLGESEKLVLERTDREDGGTPRWRGWTSGNKGRECTVAAMTTRALWRLSGRRFWQRTAGWSKWWTVVKTDFVVVDQRPGRTVTDAQVNALTTALSGKDASNARERILCLGPSAAGRLVKFLADAKGDERYHLLWLLDELGAFEKAPPDARREYFIRRLRSEKKFDPIAGQLHQRTVLAQSFADYCRTAIAIRDHRGLTTASKRVAGKVAGYKIADLKPATGVLTEAINNRNESVRYSGVYILTALGRINPAAPDDLLQAMIDRWRTERDESLRHLMLEALGNYRTPAVEKAIRAALEGDRQDLIGDCARLAEHTKWILEKDQPELRRKYIELTRHKNTKIREYTVYTLNARAPELLADELNRLSQDESNTIRCNCASAIARLKDAKYLPILVRLMNGPSERVRARAFQAVTHEPYKRLVSPGDMLGVLSTKYQWNGAVSLITQRGGPEAIITLLEGGRKHGNFKSHFAGNLKTLTGRRFDSPQALETWWWQFEINTPVSARVDLDTAKLKALWSNLASNACMRTYRTTLAMAAGGNGAVKFIAERARPVSADAASVATLIKQLGSDKYAVRQNASAELSRVGPAAQAALRAAAKGKLDAESRSRVGQLLEACQQPYPALPEARRIARAIRVLELIATPQAIAVLKAFAKGTPKTRETDRARAALKRIASRPAAATQPAKKTGITLTGRVLDKPGGKPLAAVAVTLKRYNAHGLISQQIVRTDKNGRYIFHHAKGETYASISINTPSAVWCRGARVSFKIGEKDAQSPDLYAKTNQTISGTVRDVKTGKPAPATIIGVSIPNDNPSRVTTDASGGFKLYVLPRKLTVHCYGNATSHYPPESKRTREVTVATGRHIQSIDFKVPEAPSFTGSVTLPNGKPAGGAEVDVIMKWPISVKKARSLEMGPLMHLRLQTNSKGEFRGYFRRSPYPDITNRAPDPGSKVKMRMVAFTGGQTAGVVLEFETHTRDKKRKPIQLALSKAASVTIRIVGPKNSDIADAAVSALRIRYDDHGDGTGVYGGAKDPGVTSKYIGGGRYLLTGLIPGAGYSFMLTARGYTWKPVYFRSISRDRPFAAGQRVDLGTMQLDPLSRKHVLKFIKMLSHRKQGTRASAARQLSQIYAAASDAAPGLVPFIRAQAPPALLQMWKSSINRAAAARALGAICDCDPAAVSALKTWDDMLAWWWSFPVSRPLIEPAKLGDTQLNALWKDLSGKVNVKTWRSILAMAGGSNGVVVSLAKRVRPVSTDAAGIATLIDQLGSDKYAVRQNASAELSVLGPAAHAALRGAAKGKLDAESRSRVGQLLQACDRAYPVLPEAMRVVRAIRVLELIATPQAVEMLKKLARGTPKTHATRHAQAALKRMADRLAEGRFPGGIHRQNQRVRAPDLRELTCAQTTSQPEDNLTDNRPFAAF